MKRLFVAALVTGVLVTPVLPHASSAADLGRVGTADSSPGHFRTSDDTSDGPPAIHTVVTDMMTLQLDDYQIEDLHEIANSEGITFNSAVNGWGRQDDLSEAALKLSRDHPNLFAGVVNNGDGTATVTIVGNDRATARPYFADLPGVITIETGATYSERDASDAQERLADSLAEGDPTSEFVVSYDQAVETLVVEYSSPSDPPTRQAFKLLNKRVSRQDSEQPIPVRIYFRDGNIFDPTAPVRGGENINYARGSSYTPRCTAGFSVKSLIGGRNEGIVTAQHCYQDTEPWRLSYQLRDILTWERGVRGVFGDLAFSRSDENAVPKFRVSTSSVRAVLFVGAPPAVGSQLAKFGRVSHHGRARVAARNDCMYQRGYSTPVCNQIRVRRDILDGGDSGGPAFSGGFAVAINSATSSTSNRSWFTALRGVKRSPLAELNLRVQTVPQDYRRGVS